MEIKHMQMVLIALIISVGGCVSLNSESKQKTSKADVVMFSTDYGLGIINGATNGPDRHAADVDDAYAVTLALASSLDVQSIVTTFGNDKAKPSYESVKRGLEALGYGDDNTINVQIGSEGFLDAVAVTFEPVGEVPPIFCLNTGVESMKSTLDNNTPDTVTLFALGPFTDIACLSRAYPDSYEKIKEIIALVGSQDGKPVLQNINVVDFNFAMDPTALGLVIQNNSVPITFLMFEVTQLGTLSNKIIEQWIVNGTNEQKYYAQASKTHAEYWDAIFKETDGQALFDAHTVYYFLNPELYSCEDNILATATVANYPDTSAATTNNLLTVATGATTNSSATRNTSSNISTYTGYIRACDGFKKPTTVEQFEKAVQNSVKNPK